MFDAFLTTTSSEGLQPLGSAAQRSYELVSATVRSRLGEAHAALFAEPVAAPHGDKIDWHASLQGRPQQLSTLENDEAEALRARLSELVEAIRSEAESLGASDTPDDQRLSEALTNALEIPGEEMIWAIREADGALSPVLVHWAWVRDEQRAVRGVLSKMVAKPASPALATNLAASAPAGVVAQTPVRGNARWIWWWLLLLGWLVLAGLLAAILYVLIAPCGLSQGRLIFCPGEPPEIEAALSEAQVAADEVAALEREIALVDRHCQPTIPVLPQPAPVLPVFPTPAPEDESRLTPEDRDRADVERRIDERGATRGALNFSIAWAGPDDVDLHVTCPSGETINYRKTQACGGALDLDANARRARAINDPVENVVFETAAPRGLYKVRVHLYDRRSPGPTPVTLYVLRRDGPSQTYQGRVSATQSTWITNISISN
ncbi:MAG: hypothetical protein AB3N13_13235 [Arenibacterium sp.]